MRVRYNRGALADINEILTYVSDRNPNAAHDLLLRFEAAARLISRNPEIGRQTSQPNLRRLVVGNFLLVYEISVSEIIIYYVRHGSRQRPWEGEN